MRLSVAAVPPCLRLFSGWCRFSHTPLCPSTQAPEAQKAAEKEDKEDKDGDKT